MKTHKVLLTDAEIELLISALDEKINRLEALHLADKSRIVNHTNLQNFLNSYLN